MNFDVDKPYHLKHNVKLSYGLFNGTVIPEGTKVMVRYWDDAIVNCESIDGPCDGLHFVTSPSALS
jgi:hypothetical protein